MKKIFLLIFILWFIQTAPAQESKQNCVSKKFAEIYERISLSENAYGEWNDEFYARYDTLSHSATSTLEWLLAENLTGGWTIRHASYFYHGHYNVCAIGSARHHEILGSTKLLKKVKKIQRRLFRCFDKAADARDYSDSIEAAEDIIKLNRMISKSKDFTKVLLFREITRPYAHRGKEINDLFLTCIKRSEELADCDYKKQLIASQPKD